HISQHCLKTVGYLDEQFNGCFKRLDSLCVLCPFGLKVDQMGSFCCSGCRAARGPGKQCVGLAHEPVGNEADPLLRGRVQLDQGGRARSESGEWIRLGGCESYRIWLHLKSGNSKASDSPWHMQG